MKPIFLISLPRSGSTLLQKILMSHKDIVSAAEPWFLLPLMYTYKDKGIKTEYGQKSATIALKYLKDNYFNDKNIYEKQIKEFVLNIYKDIAGHKQYFLDKTPRYYWILDDLQEIFPEAKFIVLLRNPISIFSSIIEAFHNNSIKRLDHAYNDFYIGPKKIADFINKNKDNQNIKYVIYENIVADPENEISDICNFLDIQYSNDMIVNFTSQKIKGYGDHLGVKKFNRINDNSEKWKTIINTKLRKFILKNYIKNFDAEYIELLSIKKSDLLKKINSHQINNIGFNEIYLYLEYKLIENIKLLLKYQSMH